MAIQFTEAEWLILSSMGYAAGGVDKKVFDENGYPVNGVGIELNAKVLDALEKQAKAGMGGTSKDIESEEAYVGAIESLKEKLNGQSFVISKFVNHNTEDDTGFVAMALEPQPNPEQEVVVCCRGSDAFKPENFNDWFSADVALLQNVQTDQHIEMTNFMQGMNKYSKIYLTGHSLGGNLAIYGAVTYSDQSKIEKVYAFDAPGFSDEFLEKYDKRIKNVENNILNFQNEADVISSTLYSVGTVAVVDSAVETSAVGISHYRWAFGIAADGETLNRKKGGEKSEKAKNVQAVTQKIAKKTSATKDIKIHNYSASNCEQMMQALNDFEACAFSSLEDWKGFSNCGWFINSSANKVRKYIEEYYEVLSNANQDCKRRITQMLQNLEQVQNTHLQNFQNISAMLDEKTKTIEMDFIECIRIR